MTCKDCIHYDVCQFHIDEETKMTVNECENFKNKADFVEVKDCNLCVFNSRHATEYPCSHCRHCYTDKFKPIE